MIDIAPLERRLSDARAELPVFGIHGLRTDYFLSFDSTIRHPAGDVLSMFVLTRRDRVVDSVEFVRRLRRSVYGSFCYAWADLDDGERSDVCSGHLELELLPTILVLQNVTRDGFVMSHNKIGACYGMDENDDVPGPAFGEYQCPLGIPQTALLAEISLSDESFDMAASRLDRDELARLDGLDREYFVKGTLFDAYYPEALDVFKAKLLDL